MAAKMTGEESSSLAADTESDFYGDEQTVDRLEEQVAAFDVQRGGDALAKAARPPDPPPQHNIWEGYACARLRDESVDEFLRRLPVATTYASACGSEWLWIANPAVERADEPLLRAFRKAGSERLAILSQFTAASSLVVGPSSGAVKRDLAREQKAAINDLWALAAQCKLTVGKWMLFPDRAGLTRTWEAVARATARGELGLGSKVATRQPGDEHSRVICVYTADFGDRDDVARVLSRMRELGLVEPGRGRQIYYKTDAWTHLGIYRDNEWGIRASQYSSNELFDYWKQRTQT